MSDESKPDQKVKSITILEAREAVRKRPAMYVGGNGALGLHMMVYELVQNCLDEAAAGYGKDISVTLRGDSSVTVEDRGRGIPVWVPDNENAAFAELVMTQSLKYCSDSGRKYRRMLTLGCAVVNFLSELLHLEIRRDGSLYEQSYNRGIPVTSLRQTGVTNQTGTKITFKPDSEIFLTSEYNFDWLAGWLRERAFLNKGVRLVLSDQRGADERRETFCYEDGLMEYVQQLNENYNVLHNPPIHFATPPDYPGTAIEFALQYNDSVEERMLSYANHTHTYDGGKHQIGFRSGLTRAINQYAKSSGITDKRLDGNSVRKGLVAVVSVVLSNPMCEGPKRGILATDVKEPVASFVSQKLVEYFEQHPSIGKTIVSKIAHNSGI